MLHGRNEPICNGKDITVKARRNIHAVPTQGLGSITIQQQHDNALEVSVSEYTDTDTFEYLYFFIEMFLKNVFVPQE